MERLCASIQSAWRCSLVEAAEDLVRPRAEPSGADPQGEWDLQGS